MSSSRPRTSVVTFTNGPVASVAASLRRLRPVAHEIIVAVDARVPPEDLGPLQDVADQLIRTEFVYPLEANLAWLHEQATGDWVLRLDGDDVPSEALLRLLSTPGWDEGITHAYLSYRWLWGGPDRMIEQAPWWHDPVLRLVRNVGGLATFPTGVHQPAEVAGAARFLDVPIYHLDLLLNDVHARQAKVDGYEGQAPGRRTDRGWSVSTTYYLPERLAAPPRTAPLPAVDASVVASVLELATSVAPLPAPKDPAGLRTVVTAAERRSPAPSAHDSRLRLLAHDPVVVTRGRGAWVAVGITNLSARTWLPQHEPPTVLGGRLLDEHGLPVGPELRASLPGPLRPGEEALVRVQVPAHVPAEAHRLELGVLQEGVAWHDARVVVGLEVDPGRRVLLSTGVSPYPHLGDDLITGQILGALALHLPDVVPVLLAHPTDGLAERLGCEVVPGPASLPAASARLGDSGRRSRDLVTQARLMAKGDAPTDPAVAAVLAPFADAAALIVAPGGGLASRYADSALLPTAVEVLIARAFDLPVFVEGPSIGPIELRRDHAAMAQLLNDATRITVRDGPSGDAARRIGRAIDPAVVPDPATAAMDGNGVGEALARRWLDAHGIPADRRYVVVSLRGGVESPDHLETVRAVLDALPPEIAAVYLPHCTGSAEHDDLALVQAHPWAHDHLVPWDTGLGDLAAAGLVGGAALTIGSRFHLTVLASAAGVRALALVGDEYDRLRLRGHRRLPGVAVVERDDAATAAQAAAALLADPLPEPGPRWDGAEFTDALARVLPRAPRLT